MGIYRGAGGTGDAVADSSSEALLVRNLAAEVQVDADAAAASAAAALVSENNAETAATNAATAETNAETAEANAETAQAAAEAAQSAAATSATNAASSASAASTSATNAASSASAASTSATAAASSASTASTQATNASNSASAAATSATNASNSASAAATSATNAANSATAASGSATAASSSASNASLSASNAATSETNAASSATTATTQAGLAATSATNAASSATAAATSATNASNSASTAATQATNAATSATNASNSASSAATSATNAAASYDSFDDRYLGPKSVAPTLDNDGNTLLTGALYFNTVDNAMKVWSGSAWLDAYASLSGALLALNNLSDLANKATARTNLGVAIGTNVQAWDADLDTWTTKTAPTGTVVGTSDTQTLTNKTLTTPTIDKINTSVANTSLGAGNASIMKNRIINGAMVISQRNGTSSVTPAAGDYVIDRFLYSSSQASKFTAQQLSASPPVGYTNYLGLVSTAATSLGAGDFFGISQRIEGYNIADLGFGSANAKTVTLSFWVQSSLTGTFSGSIGNGAFDVAYGFTYSIPVANTWTQISVTIPGSTTGTWLTTNGNGMRVYFSLGVGSTYGTTANTWVASGSYGVTAGTNVAGTNGATFYITGVQLEVGSSATGYEYRQYGQELALCQRYFVRIASGLGAGGVGEVIGTGNYYTATQLGVTLSFPTSMRAAPSVYQTTGTNYYGFDRNGATDDFNSFSIYFPSTQGALLYNNTEASGTAGQAGTIYAKTGSSYLGLSAEL